jgi:small subunit ribosomal protein S2
MKEISLLELLQSGAHFGHKTSRWNPKMKSYIFTVRNDIHILDLEKTRRALTKAAEFASSVAQSGGTVLFIGTKRQARSIIEKQAKLAGQPFVNVRWLGGSFTNFKTIQRTVRKLEKLQELKASGQLESRYTKKERLLVEREIEKLEKLFAGMKDMKRLPQAVYIADINHDDIALAEARKMKVPVIAIVDTNSNPEGVDYPIPCNDDATAAIELVTSVIAASIKEGKTLAPAAPLATPTAAAAPADPAVSMEANIN